MDPMHRLFVMMAVTLTIVAFLFSPVQLAISEATERDAQIQTQRIASAINLMLTSPELTTYKFEMPRASCAVVVTSSFVRLTMKPAAGQEASYTASISKTGTAIVGGEFRCKTPIQINRDGNGLRIVQGGG